VEYLLLAPAHAVGYVLREFVHAVAASLSLWRTRKRHCVRYRGRGDGAVAAVGEDRPLPARVDVAVQHERPDIKARKAKLLPPVPADATRQCRVTRDKSNEIAGQ
jgi:hypothetical protein